MKAQAYCDVELHYRQDPAPSESSFVSNLANSRVQYLLIRSFDVFAALVALIFFAPLMILLAIAIRFADGGPALFAHRRIGYDGEFFPCLKFRSMLMGAEAKLEAILAKDPNARREWEATQKLQYDPRVTSLGRFLRKSSLDELPQLINVLRGDMSIVGPRPIVEDEKRRYGRYFATYCQVRPGMTGLWQAAGRNTTTYRRRVALDVLYVRRRSFAFNIAVILRTVPSVLMARGVS